VAWLARFVEGRDEGRSAGTWEGPSRCPTTAECRAALRKHMPECCAHDRVCALVAMTIGSQIRATIGRLRSFRRQQAVLGMGMWASSASVTMIFP